MTILLSLCMVLFAYLLGALSSAVIYCRLLGMPDPRDAGSGNPGATNILRLHGNKAAVIVLLGDLLKGYLPVIISKTVGMPPFAVAMVALSAFLGHLYPVFFGFKGGKGVATSFGAILGISFPVALILVGFWLAVAYVSKYSSLAAISSALTAPLLVFIFAHTAYVLPVTLMALLLLWRHRENMVRLVKGLESKMGR